MGDRSLAETVVATRFEKIGSAKAKANVADSIGFLRAVFTRLVSVGLKKDRG